eukprot:3613193-Pleurochrysis_carterae.AAC.1
MRERASLDWSSALVRPRLSSSGSSDFPKELGLSPILLQNCSIVAANGVMHDQSAPRAGCEARTDETFRPSAGGDAQVRRFLYPPLAAAATSLETHAPW